MNLRQLYEESFPPEERRPWTEPAGHWPRTTIFDGGFFGWWAFPGFVYIEHFAVLPSLRGAGVGGRALDDFCRSAAKPVVLEAEPPTMGDMARRRLAFYSRHGFSVLDKDYIQPPYGEGLPSVPLYLLSNAPVDVSTAIQTLHREVYGELI